MLRACSVMRGYSGSLHDHLGQRKQVDGTGRKETAAAALSISGNDLIMAPADHPRLHKRAEGAPQHEVSDLRVGCAQALHCSCRARLQPGDRSGGRGSCLCSRGRGWRGCISEANEAHRGHTCAEVLMW